MKLQNKCSISFRKWHLMALHKKKSQLLFQTSSNAGLIKLKNLLISRNKLNVLKCFNLLKSNLITRNNLFRALSTSMTRVKNIYVIYLL